MPQRLTVNLVVNGETYEREVEPRILLSDFLRHELGLTGTHVGCEHGVCGACTILMDGVSVRSCTIFAVQANGHEIRTVEDLSRDGELDPLQQSFKANHALQCGYCTPGMLMTTVDLLANHTLETDADIREAISGNICRCTGYHNIVNAIREALAARSGRTEDS